MTKRRRLLTVAATAGASALIATAALAAPATAAPRNAEGSGGLTTYCEGEGGAVTVPGDLVVPADSACYLTGTTVQGDVRVEANSDLLVSDGTIAGDVTVGENAYFDVIDTEASGSVALEDAYGAYLGNSSVDGEVATRTSADADRVGFIYSVGTGVTGDVVATGGDVYLSDAEVGGNLVAQDSDYADVERGFIDGNVEVTGSANGSILCGVTVQGDTKLSGNTGPVQLGSNGPVLDCQQPSYWGGAVTLEGTAGDSYIDNSIVNADLVLSENDPLTNVGPSTAVRGEINGDYTEWDGESAPSTNRSRTAASADRGEEAEAKAADRKASAGRQAAKIGAANL